MSNTTTRLRIDASLVEAAKTIGDRHHRTATQQITHWANLGRELEASRSITVTDVAEVLAGRRRYDDLSTPEDKAATRAGWTTALDADLDGIDLSAHLQAKGITTWVDIAADGTLVHRTA